MNLALRGLPVFRCLPQPVGQHRTTTHLLPDEDVIGGSMDQVGAHSLVATSGAADRWIMNVGMDHDCISAI